MTTSTSHLIPAHGGELVQLIATSERGAELKSHSREWPSWDLTGRQLCDLELLLSGGFSPLRGFMTKADYEGVCHNMRLASGVLWPMPITLDVTEDFAKKLTPGTSKVALRDPEGVMVAVLHVEEVWQPDRQAEAKAVFGTASAVHPGVDYSAQQGQRLVCGRQARRSAGPVALRLQGDPADAGGIAGGVCAHGMAAGGGVPDAEPHAPGARGTDVPRREDGGSESADSSFGRHDQAG